MSSYAEALNNQCKFQYLHMKLALDHLKASKYAHAGRSNSYFVYVDASAAFNECMREAMKQSRREWKLI